MATTARRFGLRSTPRRILSSRAGVGAASSHAASDDARGVPLLAAAAALAAFSALSVAGASVAASTPPAASEQGRTVPTARHHQYIIMGAGTTAHAAVEAIFAEDPNADVLMISPERMLPHPDALERRTNLGPDLLHSYNEWRRHITGKLESEPDAFSAKVPVALVLGHHGAVLDKDRKRLELLGPNGTPGEHFTFDKLLFANAGRPQKFYALDVERERYLNADVINTLMVRGDFEDVESVADTLPEGSELAVVGGGFLGTEVALALSKRVRGRGFKVYQVYAERAPLAQYLPTYLSLDLMHRLRRHGVLPIPERLVTDLKTVESAAGSKEDDEFSDFIPFMGDDDADEPMLASIEGQGDGKDAPNPSLPLRTGRALVNLVGPRRERANLNYVVIASTHVIPEVEDARAAGLEIDNHNGGVVTNEHLEASNGIYAAGSIASYFDTALGRRRRVNRYDHSVNSGIVAGANMVTSNTARFVSGPSGRGAPLPHLADSGGLLTEQNPYCHQPTFKCFLPELKVMCEVIGEISSGLETVGVFLDRSSHGEIVSAPKKVVEWDEISSPSVASVPAGEEVTLPPPLSDVSTTSPYRRGAVYYIRRNKIVGIVLWNTSDQLHRARDVLRHHNSFDGKNSLMRRIPLAPDDWLLVKHEPARDVKARPLVTEDAQESLVYF